jgi:dihydrofolate reductase
VEDVPAGGRTARAIGGEGVVSVPIAIVAAIAENGVIGIDGGLPWRVKSDLRKFRAITMGKPLIMGRRTFESLGRVLDGRDVVVVTRQPDFAAAGAFVTGSLEAAQTLAQRLAAGRGAQEVCIGGGGEIYRETLPLAERLYITHVSVKLDGDTRFPEISPADWIETSREPLPPSPGDTAEAVHVVYSRRR